MRSPVIAFSIFAAATVGPTLVSGAPASPASPDLGNVANHLPVVGSVPGTGAAAGNLPTSNAANTHIGSRSLGDPNDQPTPPSTAGIQGLQSNSHGNQKHKGHKRAYDAGTAGGNAYTGGASNASGGTVVNENEDDTAVLTNDASGKMTLC